jgi:leucyl aminopeptidase (aminopeptidase T)
MSDLERAVAAVVRECMGVGEGEAVLVVCNPATQGLGERLRGAAEDAGGDAVLTVMAERGSHAAEPPGPVAAAMREADVVLVPTVQSMSHTAARKAATEAGARVATLPGATEDMLARLMSVDMAELRRRSDAIADLLTAGTEAHVTCPRGSDLRLGIQGRTGIPDAGDLRRPGAFGNLPCGEGFIAPVEGTSEGRLIVAGTIATLEQGEPSELVVKAGRLVSASGSRGRRLMDLLTAHGEDGTNVAELGIGTNENARPSGEVLEDEKILGTAHVAFGASAAIGGTVQVPVHLDCVVLEPDLTVDGTPVVRGGTLVV